MQAIIIYIVEVRYVVAMDVEAESYFVKDTVMADYSLCVICPPFLGRSCRLRTTLMNLWKILAACEMKGRRLDGHEKASKVKP